MLDLVERKGLRDDTARRQHFPFNQGDGSRKIVWMIIDDRATHAQFLAYELQWCKTSRSGRKTKQDHLATTRYCVQCQFYGRTCTCTFKYARDAFILPQF